MNDKPEYAPDQTEQNPDFSTNRLNYQEAEPTTEGTAVPASRPGVNSHTNPIPVPGIAHEPGPITTPPRGNRKKRAVIFGSLLTGLALLIGGGFAIYALWYQNPDKVLSDAVVNALRAKTVMYTGSFEIKPVGEAKENGSISNISLQIDGKNSHSDGQVGVKYETEIDGKKLTLDGAGLYDKDANLYVKVAGIKKAIETFMPTETEMPPSIDKLITKIDGSWIKISADDLKKYNEDYAKTHQCTIDVWKKYENNKDFTDKVTAIYKANRFITIEEKLPARDGSLGYVIDGDRTKVKGFIKAFKTTQFAKDLEACDDSFSLDEDDIVPDQDSETDESTTTRVEVWVDRWSHQFTELSLTGKDDTASGRVEVKPQFNAPVTVTPPKNSISLEELQKDIEAIQRDMFTNVQTTQPVRVEATSTT